MTRRELERSDVLSRRLFRGAELAGIEFPVGALSLLALWLFLRRHADARVFVFVRDLDESPDLAKTKRSAS